MQDNLQEQFTPFLSSGYGECFLSVSRSTVLCILYPIITLWFWQHCPHGNIHASIRHQSHLNGYMQLGSLALRAVQIPPAADDMTARAYSISALHSLRTGTTERQNMTLSEQSGDIVVVNNMALASTQMRVYSSITGAQSNFLTVHCQLPCPLFLHL